MTRDELLKFHETLCNRGRDIMDLKNRDYAGNSGTEPFANFTRCESMGITTTEAGFLVRITDKMSRLSSFLESGKMHVEDEGFQDTVVDVINYMVLLAAYMEDQNTPDEDKIGNLVEPIGIRPVAGTVEDHIMSRPKNRHDNI